MFGLKFAHPITSSSCQLKAFHVIFFHLLIDVISDIALQVGCRLGG